MQSLNKYWVRKNFAGNVFVKTNEFYQLQGGLKNSWNLIWNDIDAYSIDEAKDIGYVILPKTEFFSDLSLENQLEIVKIHLNDIDFEKGYLVCKVLYTFKTYNTKHSFDSPCRDKLTIYLIDHPKAIEKFKTLSNMMGACE